MDSKAMYSLSYGLFVLSTKIGEKNNGCIVNTAVQVTTAPNRISVTVNKGNLTHDMLAYAKIFNLSVISEEASFELFRHFGFQSGRETDKFRDYPHVKTAENGVAYVTQGVNAVICGEVIQAIDLGTHTMFIADVTDAFCLSGAASATYAYYQKNIKPKPQAAAETQEPEKKKGYVCSVCGYVYEGETLPEDYVCPICKHGAEAFEPL